MGRLFTREALIEVGGHLVYAAVVVGGFRLLIGKWAPLWLLSVYVSVLLGFWLGRFGRE